MSKRYRAGFRHLFAFWSWSLTACTSGDAPTAARVNPGPYHANVLDLARANDAYRRVLFTGAKSQLVVMSIPPGSDVGEESHRRVEQILFCADGAGQALINGKSSPFRRGDVVVVPPGTLHNFLNTEVVPLKIYTIYAPPNHLPGRVQATKGDAEADVEDSEFGRQVEAGGSVGEP